jgi:CheY-like chemotaxis protein
MASIAGSPRILLVDDNEALRRLMAIYLGHRGYNVLEAANGKTAIHIASTRDPKFILLDLQLPDISGVDVARRLQEMSQTAQIPIVGWSGNYISKAEQKSLVRAGLIECLRKPVEPRMLESVIERLVPKPQP